ncbi:MAG: galactokinase family protein [Kiritimatiellia bacterium]
MDKAVYNELMSKYRARFGFEPGVVAYAPGRIEVLGNHTDYNEGYVLLSFIFLFFLYVYYLSQRHREHRE